MIIKWTWMDIFTGKCFSEQGLTNPIARRPGQVVFPIGQVKNR